MQIKVVFMGSPEFALPTLKGLAAHYCLAGVVTQPDRPAGRGRVLTPPPVKMLADELKIETIQPERMREAGVFEKLQAWQPDVIVVAAFGQILRQNVLDLPPYGCINVHASYLPRWRGAAPIQAAILHGDPTTGVTIMKMDAGIDTGPYLHRRELAISNQDTAATLGDRLSALGAELLFETLPEYLAGRIRPIRQDESLATYAGMLKKEEGELDFEQPAEILARRVRAFNPWPGAFTSWHGYILKIHMAHSVTQTGNTPGMHEVIEGKPAIGASQGWLVLDEVQPAGKKAMPGEVFLRGVHQW